MDDFPQKVSRWCRPKDEGQATAFVKEISEFIETMEDECELAKNCLWKRDQSIKAKLNVLESLSDWNSWSECNLSLLDEYESNLRDLMTRVSFQSALHAIYSFKGGNAPEGRKYLKQAQLYASMSGVCFSQLGEAVELAIERGSS